LKAGAGLGLPRTEPPRPRSKTGLKRVARDRLLKPDKEVLAGRWHAAGPEGSRLALLGSVRSANALQPTYVEISQHCSTASTGGKARGSSKLRRNHAMISVQPN
jgi:hypothetical protein